MPGITDDTVDYEITDGNDLTGCYEISNKPNLETITVNENSLQNVPGLKITNNPKLHTITFGGSSCTNTIKLLLTGI